MTTTENLTTEEITTRLAELRRWHLPPIRIAADNITATGSVTERDVTWAFEFIDAADYKLYGVAFPELMDQGDNFEATFDAAQLAILMGLIDHHHRAARIDAAPARG